METEDILTKRKNKLIKWVKDPYNLTLSLIIIFAIILRLYYYSLTKSQPLWWDEAEYLNMAKAWAFNLDYHFIPVRPVMFSLILAGFCLEI